jgi:hypothetical protein
MRIPRLRFRFKFSIKHMMIGTALMALIMGGCRLAWLASCYRSAAKNCATLEFVSRSAQDFVQGNSSGPDELALLLGIGPLAEDQAVRAAAARGFQQSNAHYAALRRKYEQAAASPWLAVDEAPLRPAP